MLKLIRTTTLILSVFIFTSCFGLFDSGTYKVVDDYEVTWIDLVEQRALYKHEELAAAYVFAVGHNEKYIFAKQHPLLTNSTEKIDKSITNYYIIERTKNEFQDKPKYGPLTKERFDSLCIRLEIKDARFDKTFPTNL
jgi:hypothetical protein